MLEINPEVIIFEMGRNMYRVSKTDYTPHPSWIGILLNHKGPEWLEGITLVNVRLGLHTLEYLPRWTVEGPSHDWRETWRHVLINETINNSNLQRNLHYKKLLLKVECDTTSHDDNIMAWNTMIKVYHTTDFSFSLSWPSSSSSFGCHKFSCSCCCYCCSSCLSLSPSPSYAHI